MKFLFFLFFSLVFFSCQKEEMSHTKTIYKNTTVHKIRVVPFSGGIVDNQSIKLVSALSETLVYEANVRGKTLSPSLGTLFQPYDSVVVYYDDTVRIAHIKFNLPYSGSHKVLFTSNRSISNENNYEKFITNEKKCSLTGYFQYTFTEQDYLDAKR